RSSVNANEVGRNVAVTAVSALIVTVQGLIVPEHPPPLHPAKYEPGGGCAAASVTVVPESNASTQAAPHATPPGRLVTGLAVPALVTVSTGLRRSARGFRRPGFTPVWTLK